MRSDDEILNTPLALLSEEEYAPIAAPQRRREQIRALLAAQAR